MKSTSARGTTIWRGEPGFDEAVLSTSFSAQDPGRRPQVVCQANDAADVQAALALAGSEGLRVSICSGGHSWNQNHIRKGGMLLDLSRLNSMDIRVEDRIAVVGPACLGGDLDAALAISGLFFPVAHAYTVAVAGFLLAGGFGWNCRMTGMACESVVGIDVVLADGRLVHATETENAELLWAARGAGPGFFGVIVAFHLALHERPRFIGIKAQIFRIRHLEEVFAWADQVGPSVSPKVEFQMIMNRRALGIFSQGIEVMAPVLANTRTEAREAVAFIDRSPMRPKASFTLPLISMTLTRVMRAAERIAFPRGIRWAVDNMWLADGPIDPLLPHLRQVAQTQPAAPAHALWMNWNPARRERPDMAFALEGKSYLALYGGIKGKSQSPADESWATDNIRAMQAHGKGIQLGDENLARRAATFTSDANSARMDMLRARYDPLSRFFSYGHTA